MNNHQQKDMKTGPILTVLLVGAIAAILNQTVLNVALPTLTTELNVFTSTAQWLITLYMLVNGVSIPVTAFLMARFSTRQLFFTAMIVFSLGTVLCGFAPNFTVLLIGRVVQALGAGIVMPLLINVVFTLFPIEKRGAAMGIVGVAIMFAPAVGPTLSGLLITTFSWRYIFFAILPFSITALIASFFVLKNVSEPRAAKLDVLGVIASTLGFGGILYGFGIAGKAGWGSATVITTLTIGVISLTLFAIRQFKTDHPLINLRIFKSREYTYSIIITFFVNCVSYAGMILIPIYLQTNRGLTALESGLFLLPGSIAMAIMSPIAGKMFDRYGIKWLGIIGTFLLVVTTAYYTNLTYSTGIILLSLIYVIRSLGLTFLTMPMSTAGLNALPAKLYGDGTAMQNTILAISGAIGTAVMTTIMTMQTSSFINDAVITTGGKPDAKQLDVITADGLLHGINSAFVGATVFGVIALIIMFLLAISINKRKKTTVMET
ncbi:DHA2 family efflux MFS transporter permease subunit [Solibacillus sp. CAU 1738]|uniref:DHA2 family efflux MFS transporter permease subunit n=1 Tax=Solibacillus sp. CAU 1738 TaxID=3140363 RepID=UPI003261316B